MGASERAELLAEYRRAAAVFAETARGVSEAALDAPTEDGEDGVWSVRAHVHHAADVSLMGALRIRLALAGATLEYWRYDQAAYQRANRYERGVESSLALIAAAAESAAELLEHLSAEQWAAPLALPDGGTFTAADWVRNAARHLREHAGVIERAAG